MITLLLVAAALAWLLWPRGTPLPSPAAMISAATEAVAPTALPAAPATPAASPSEREAIDSLLVLRNRLASDGVLPEASAKAIDALALDILHQGTKR